MSVMCPVCAGDSLPRLSVGSEQMRAALRNLYGDDVPQSVHVDGYGMRRCTRCDLVFADPFKAGDEAFYSWITAQDNYYPRLRWEWEPVIGMIGTSQERSPEVIDIGCGSGDFLTVLGERLQGRARGFGLDTTSSSIKKCRARGLDAACLDIAGFSAQYPDRRFDFCVTFHCIEHVEDPLGFMEEMKRLLKPGGKLIVSAPYSPMSFEAAWFDPLNHPPHHLTRWNRKALEALAGQLAMKLTLTTSPAPSFVSRVFRGFQLAVDGRPRVMSTGAKLALLVAHPLVFLGNLMAQASREQVGSKVAGDTFLAIFEVS